MTSSPYAGPVLVPTREETRLIARLVAQTDEPGARELAAKCKAVLDREPRP